MKKMIRSVIYFGTIVSLCTISIVQPLQAIGGIGYTLEEAVEVNEGNLSDNLNDNENKKDETYLQNVQFKNLDERIKRNEETKAYELSLENLEKKLTKNELKEILPTIAMGIKDGKVIEIPVVWSLDSLGEEIDAGEYTLTPKLTTEYEIYDTTINNIMLKVSYEMQEKEVTTEAGTNPIALDDVVTDFSIKWKDTNEKEIVVEAMENHNPSTFMAELTLSLTKANIQPNEIEIRLPARIFTNRDQQKQGDYKLAFNNSATNISFQASYDKITDEIVITNKLPITDALTFKTDLYYYNLDPYKNEVSSQIPHHSTHSFQAKLTLTQNNQKETINTEKLSVVHDLMTKLNTVSVVKEERVFTWEDAWGSKPADANEYFYIKWRFGVSISLGDTDPYTLPFELELHSSGSHEGEVVAWDRLDFTGNGSSEFIKKDKDLLLMQKEPGNGSRVTGIVIMKYPKSSIKDYGEAISEKLEATLKPYYEEDEVTIQNGEGNADYTYIDLQFQYPAGKFSLDKSRSESDSDVFGGLNKIKNLKNDEVLSLPQDYYTHSSFENEIEVEAGDLTFEGNDKNDINNYEKKVYYTELVDDLILLDGKRLMKEDYQIPYVVVNNYSHYKGKINEDTGNIKYEEVQDANEISPIEIFCSESLDGNSWEKVAEVIVLNEDAYQIAYTNGDREIVETNAKVNLPDGAVAIKACTTTKNAKIKMYVHLPLELKNTKHVQEIVENKSDKIDVRNVSTLVIRDDQGNWVNPQDEISIDGTPGIEAIVKERDALIFGNEAVLENKKYGQHDHNYYYLKPVDLFSQSFKTIRYIKQKDDYFELLTYIMGKEGFNHNSMLTNEECQELDLVKEQTHAQIFDLLPAGTFVDEDSLLVGYTRNSNPNGDSFEKIDDCSVKIEYINNWRSSGRTMAVFTIETPENYSNYYYSSQAFTSSLCLRFDMIYPFDSVVDYGKNIHNLAAYKSLNGGLSEGLADNADTSLFSDVEKEWFNDLDGDGEDTIKDTLYCFDDAVCEGPMYSQIEFSKNVRSNRDLNYIKETEVLPKESYSYRIHIGKSDSSQSKNIVMYDVLEQAYQDNEACWQGTLESVDVSQPILKGIDAKVYYSTKPNIQLHAGMNGELVDDADLTNKDIWQETMPADKSSITAIAVDMRKDINGQEFILEDNERISIVINMKAPNSYVGNNAKAYNDAWVNWSFKLDNGEFSSHTSQCPRTTVATRKYEMALDKTSDPISGTKEQPTEVHNDDNLTYDVAITNKEMSIDIEDIVMVDEIPKGLEIDFDEIKYYYNNDKQNAKSIHDEDDGLSVVRDQTKQQKLTFTIKRLEANETIHFIIPTKVIATDEAARYENQAVITEVGSSAYEIKSPITYHEKKVELANFEFLKKNKQDENVSNAKFVLYEMNCANNAHDHTNELLKVDKNGDLIQESTCFTKHGEASSGSDGKVTFVGLKTSKTYRLIEYEAPKEYITPKGQWVLAYDETSKSFKVVESIGNPPGFEKPDSTWIVRNYTIEELPTTGGRGLTKFMTIGTVVMIVGGYWIYSSRKKRRI